MLNISGKEVIKMRKLVSDLQRAVRVSYSCCVAMMSLMYFRKRKCMCLNDTSNIEKVEMGHWVELSAVKTDIAN